MREPIAITGEERKYLQTFVQDEIAARDGAGNDALCGLCGRSMQRRGGRCPHWHAKLV